MSAHTRLQGVWYRMGFITLLAAAAQLALAQSRADVLFEDNFDAGLKPEWVLVNGVWWIEDGWLHLQDTDPAFPRHGHLVVHDGDTTWTNYTISVQVDPLLAQDPYTGAWYEWAEVCFRTRDTIPSMPGPKWRGYTLLLSGPGTYNGAYVDLWHQDHYGGPNYLLAEVPGVVGSGPVNVTIDAQDARIRVWIDNNLIIDVIDPDPYTYGGVAFDTIWESHARYDNLVVEVELPPCETAKLMASDGAPGDSFGGDLGADGERIVAGADQDDNEDGVDAGAAYVFRRHGVEWVQEAKLTAWDGRAGDHFGQAVGLVGDRIVVGAPQQGWGGNGAVYIFRLAGSVWVPEAKLEASDGQPMDLFGLFLAFDGERIAVSAIFHPQVGTRSGALYVFEHSGDSWVERAELGPSDAEPYLQFGATVAVDADRIVTGANDAAHSYTGAAYVFRYDGLSWNQEAKLTAQSPAAEDNYYHVAIDGEVICVGADQRWGSGPGFVDVYRRSGTTWAREAHLTASDGAPGDSFSYSSIDGDRMAVGAPYIVGGIRGAVYLFQHDESGWHETDKITSSDYTPGDAFGVSVSLNGGSLIASAPQAYSGGPGKAYVFAVGGEDCNHNGVPDWCDIASGTVTDFNHDAVPDQCEDLGDLNCDGRLDFGDINPFVLAMTNWGHYLRLYPNCDIYRADINGDGYVDFDDINLFVALLSQ